MVAPVLLGLWLTACEQSPPPSVEAPTQEVLSSTSEVGSDVVPLQRSWRTVVVDAGHGGGDEGAHGVSGIHEKDVVLAFSRSTARALRAAGFEVVETRTEDVDVTLDRRTELANASGAGIFVSIHANSAPTRSIGASSSQ